jgi:hypothetical protein
MRYIFFPRLPPRLVYEWEWAIDPASQLGVDALLHRRYIEAEEHGDSWTR